jgi:glyoxylase-like metal-dependent hydrolase (beta-lactamase superfamily II)
MKIEHFFDAETSTYSYILIDDTTSQCAIIDPVLNYNQFSGSVSYNSANLLIDYIKQNKLELEWILETHPHADHLTSAQYLKKELGGKVAIGEDITKVLEFWAPIFGGNFNLDGKDFDKLLKNEEIINIGNLKVKVMKANGHTPACVCYLVEDVIFVGDVIFQPYVGTARTDFAGGSAKDLYNSIQKIFELNENTKIYVGHDYPQEGKNPKPFVTIKDEKALNIMIQENITEEDFILKRNAKDKGKAVPKLIFPAIQFNIRAGKFEEESNGKNYIKIPINQLGAN